MKIDLLGSASKQRFGAFNFQETINWYMVIDPPTNKDNEATGALFPTPGLPVFVSLPGRYFRGFYTVRLPGMATRCFAAVDQTLYEIFQNKSYNTLGTMPNISLGTSKIYLVKDNANELGIFDINAGYVLNLNSNLLTQITTNQYVGNVSCADYMDGAVFVTSNGAVFFTQEGSLSPMLTGWLSTNTYTPGWDGAPTIALKCLREQIFNFTTESIEIFINDGTSPYSRLPKTTVYIGLVAKESLCCLNDGFLFLGRGHDGETTVFFFDSYYNCQPMSDFSTTFQINLSGIELSDAYAHLQYSSDGHIFYRLTIPALRKTFVYDLITKQWHTRSSIQPYQNSDGTIVHREFRGRHYTDFNGMHLFGDLYSGTIFVEDINTMFEGTQSNFIRRVRKSQRINENQQTIFLERLELDANPGYAYLNNSGKTTLPSITWDQEFRYTWDTSPIVWGTDEASLAYSKTPTLQLELSSDGGYNFRQAQNLNLGKAGDHGYRIRKDKLGSGKNYVVQFTLTDPTDLMIQSAWIKGDIGNY